VTCGDGQKPPLSRDIAIPFFTVLAAFLSRPSRAPSRSAVAARVVFLSLASTFRTVSQASEKRRPSERLKVAKPFVVMSRCGV